MGDQFLNNELRQQINLYFDKALNKEDEIELMNKVNSDTKIQDLFDEEKLFRNKIKNGLSRTIASATLIDSVRNNIDTL